MSWPKDDPRWTAHVLGDLADNERAEAEAQLAEDPALRRYVEELGQTVTLLQTVLQEPVPGTERIVDDCGDAIRKTAPAEETPSTRSFALWLPTAIAAILVIGLGMAYFHFHRLQHGETRVYDEISDAPIGLLLSDIGGEADEMDQAEAGESVDSVFEATADPMMDSFRLTEAPDEAAPLPRERWRGREQAKPDAETNQRLPVTRGLERRDTTITSVSGRQEPAPDPAPPASPQRLQSDVWGLGGVASEAPPAPPQPAADTAAPAGVSPPAEPVISEDARQMRTFYRSAAEIMDEDAVLEEAEIFKEEEPPQPEPDFPGGES
ncbi:MAG: hypothetical protein JJU29_22170, partial [Verrucomicrobia bacterium]|nr:hypothetical protein [Verrucomicrobiota bacterium]